MAQHDYVIDNQSAPAFRADLNNALAAVVSQNSGSAAPTVTFANMFWYDTVNNQLKKRNESDTGWITLGTIDEASGRFTPTGSSDTGAVTYFATSTAPSGWLKANGAAVSRTTYSALFSVIGTTFGAGDGSTTFNIPDLRGEFLRGWDDARGVDSGRVFGSAQSSQNLAHTHTMNVSFSPDVDYFGNNVTILNAGQNGVNSVTGQSIDLTSASSGGSEARPRNIALLACIKF